jgi:hypothetical protein
MNTFAAESAAWKLAGIGQDIATEARAIALDIKRGNPVAAHAAHCRKLIVSAERALEAIIAALEPNPFTGPPID